MEENIPENSDEKENMAECSTDQGSPETKKSEPPSKTASQESQRLNVSDPEGNNNPVSREDSSVKLSRSESRSPGSRRSTSNSDQTRSSRRKKKNTTEGENSHKVTFTVTISQAIPKSESEDGTNGGKKKTGRILEQPKAENYYHFEYFMLPDDAEPVKTDVVTFGVAAKIYTLRHEPKVIKTWVDGEVTWVAWTDSHTICMTEDILEKLTTHTLELRIWDTRDKLSAKARFDRPKAFRLPQPKPGEDSDNSGTKGLVLKQAANFESSQPKISYINRPLPPFSEIDVSSRIEDTKYKRQGSGETNKRSDRFKDSTSTIQSPANKQNETPPENLEPPTEDGQPLRSYSRLGRLAGLDKSPDISSKPASGGGGRSQSRPADFDESSGAGKNKGRKNKKAEAAVQAAAEHIKKFGICCIPIKMANFFSAGTMSYTSRIENPMSGLEDVFFSVALNKPLMSEDQKKILNPLVIKVQSANDMPNTPISYADLQMKCLPTYVQYQIMKFPVHTSIGRPQAQNIYWDDVNIILTGKLDPAKLRECLYGPPLQIEIHDRDRVEEKQPLKPTLFGDDLEDEKISNVGTVSSKRTLHNPFDGRDKPWDPYGISKFDLSGLLLGQQVLNLTSAIRQCPIPDVLGLKDGRQNGKLIGIAGAVDGPTDQPFPPGHYLENNSVLKIKVEVAHPLVTTDQLAVNEPLPSSTQCPFARIVFKFDYKNVAFLSQLQSLITELNSAALELSHLPPHVIEAALSTYKLSVDQQKSRELDIVTGFQLLDGEMHLFVLEGLRNAGIQRLWESLPKPENADVEILYHSDLSFTERIYGPLDVDVCRIKLHEPLSLIVQQPLLYVRDMVPKACFEALIKLGDLSSQKRLRDAVRNEMFPTAEMVISMSREFGVPLTAADFEELQVNTKVLDESPTREVFMGTRTSREWTPIDNFNEKYVDQIHDRSSSGHTTNFIADNKDSVRRQSELNFIERSKTMPVTIRADVSRAHNYSAQSLNTTEMAKEKLRKELSKNPDTRYTYCPEYHHSMTVVPVDVEAMRKKEKENLISAFRSPAGWTYPGKKTMIQSNAHPKKPDSFRSKQLYQPWAENTLHSTVLEPPLERDRLTWDDRRADFDVWTHPNPVFNPQDPVTIQLAGEKLKQERLDAKKKDHALWQSRVMVDDSSMYFWRCATETELKDRGFKSSNQLERLRGVLKDPPHKLSFRKPGVSIPPLNVVQNPSVDTQARLAGLPTRPAAPGETNKKIKGYNPGPHDELSWVRPGNHIPCPVYDHEKFTLQKGADFNVYHKERPRHYKRHIEPLNDVEYSRHLFRWPQQPGHYSMIGPNALAFQVPDMDEYRRHQSLNRAIDGDMRYHNHIEQAPHDVKTAALLET